MGTKTARRVLVTGGAGFLGSHLCERLLEKGQEVLCVDNFFCSSRGNVAHLVFWAMRASNSCATTSRSPSSKSMRSSTLPCPASPVHYQSDPVQTTKTSVIGAINMPGLAKRLKVKILQASTSESTGTPTSTRRLEEYWATSIRLDCDRATTKQSDVRRRCFSTIGGSTIWRSRSCASSTPTAPACTPMMGGCVEFHHPGLERRGYHDLWRRQPVALFLLRRRLVEALLLMMETSPD